MKDTCSICGWVVGENTCGRTAHLKYDHNIEGGAPNVRLYFYDPKEVQKQ